MKTIDLMHLGRARVIGSWLDDDVIVDCGPTSTLDTLLAGTRRCRAVGAAAHAHPLRPRRRERARLAHGGPSCRCTSTSAERRTWPTPSGCTPAPRASTAMTWIAAGARFCPSRRRTCTSRRRRAVLGRFQVAYTPGHASHHVSYLHDGTAFVGDVGGVRITPESDDPADAAARHRRRGVARVDRGRPAWKPERLAMTHFGARPRTSRPSSTRSKRGSTLV